MASLQLTTGKRRRYLIRDPTGLIFNRGQKANSNRDLPTEGTPKGIMDDLDLVTSKRQPHIHPSHMEIDELPTRYGVSTETSSIPHRPGVTSRNVVARQSPFPPLP
ncbi:Hypothetical protein NTJ_02317 [Nesidiocoris tenuis]|uniref:Uncharacterized protein n=1 Tax=Nesidiocoris tenuis TaxID=355587 RepID=A0ABN7AB63_9HEMI|nr:Hypothetical protein NTJ_02317 [Nesidiocoris tenuis]